MPEKTLGEQRTRTEFIPSNNSDVHQIKQKTAELINLVESVRFITTNDTSIKEQARLIALAQTAYEEAAMWAVKAATA